MKVRITKTIRFNEVDKHHQIRFKHLQHIGDVVNLLTYVQPQLIFIRDCNPRLIA